MRKRRSRPEEVGGGGVALGLIITPMLDMSFQILSFFIMTYHPSALEGHINGNLVPPSKTLIASKDKVDPTDMPLLPDSDPDPEDTLQVIAKAAKPGQQERQRVDGQPTTIYVKKKEDPNVGEIVADSDEPLELSMSKLKDKLKASLMGGGMKGNIRLECEAEMKHMYVMRIYDVCKQAGFQNVSFVAPVPSRKKD